MTESDWIEHDGSGMPVPGDTLVYVRLGGGWDDTWCGAPRTADWWHEDEPEDSSWVGVSSSHIVAYRIVEPVT